MVKLWYPLKEDESCLKMNNAGMPYEDFGCLYPSYDKTYMAWEKSYDPVVVRDYIMVKPWIPITACLAYVVFIFAGQAYFKKRERLHWRWTLAAWNLGLSVFSAVGVFRVLPQFVHNFTHFTLEENFCFDPESHYASASTGIWIQFFILSKFPELLDTFFIVIHKKPLIFLHWYHHVSVLLYCWHSYVYKAPAGILFCVMNYAVHSIMYFYYFLMAARMKPKWFQAVWITVAQISQMVVGVAATVYCNYLLFIAKPDNCFLGRENNIAALVMYGSYLFLFLQFFLGRYFTTKTQVGKTASSEGKIKST